MATPADHPSSCEVCHGTGWQPAPDIERDGMRYSSVEPCAHHWRDDAPSRAPRVTLHEYRERLRARGDDEQLAAIERYKRLDYRNG